MLLWIIALYVLRIAFALLSSVNVTFVNSFLVKFVILHTNILPYFYTQNKPLLLRHIIVQIVDLF